MWHMQSLAEQTWQYCDQREKNRAGKSESRHGEIEKVGRRFSRSHARDVTAVFLQIICDLRWLELRGDPKITEKENHRREHDIMWPAGGKRVGDAVGDRTVFKHVADNRRRKKKERPGKDDRHHAGIIHF